MEARRRALMENQELYKPEMLGVDEKYGHIKGYPVGSMFENRESCLAAGVHRAKYAGICPGKYGASSICMSSGYEDDEDQGNFFIYTGTGGQATEGTFHGTGSQIDDQSFRNRHNAALAKSVQTQRPVRVIRGPNPKSPFAPAKGFRYDGLYIVERAYMGKGISGHAVCKYHLRRVPGQPPLPRTVGPSV